MPAVAKAPASGKKTAATAAVKKPKPKAGGLWATIMPVGMALRTMGAFLLPTLIVDHLSGDEVVVAMAAGGEWARLNGTTAAACFGLTNQTDSHCRYTAAMDCAKHGAQDCVWGDPRELGCAGATRCAGLDRRKCASEASCEWTSPLDQRLRCRSLPAHHPMGGRRCAGLFANEPDATAAIREELRVMLYQVFAFVIANVWLLRWYGSADRLFKKGRGVVLALFGAVAACGYVRSSFVEFGEMRFL